MRIDEEQGVDPEIAKMFAVDSKEKKIVGRGIHNRASRKSGLRRPVSFPYEYMDSKEKRQYMKGGKVEVYSLLDRYNSLSDVPKDYNEFYKMEDNFAKELLTKIRTFATVTELAKHFGFKDKKNVYKKLLDRYDIKVRENYNKPKNNKTVDIEQHNNELLQSQMEAFYRTQNIMIPKTQETAKEGYTINLKGTYDESSISRRVQSLFKMIEEDKRYKINISITEIRSEER